MPIALLALQHGAEVAEGPMSPFEVNFGIFFWTWLIFIALFLVLKKYAFPAIVKATVEREQAIARQVGEAERLRADAESTLAEQKKLLAESRDSAQSMMSEARSAAEKERAHLLVKAREEHEALLERARREIGAERDKAVQDLRREAVDISLAAASKLIGQRLDQDADRRLVQEYISKLEPTH
ncbi:MAG: F0F1 ATP synthase subunit B [Gemmatimonadales bacterium]